MADPLIMASVLAVDFVGDQLNVTFGPVDSVHGGKMGGGTLTYKDVPRELVRDFIRAPDKDAFFRTHILGKFSR